MFFAASALASPIAGSLVERVGFRPGLRASAIGSAITLAGIGALATRWWVLVCLLIVGGIANAIAEVSTTLLIARRVPAQKQGFAFGIRQSAIPAATLLGGLAVPAIALTIGWRWSFLGAASVALIVALRMPLVDEIVRPQGERSPPRDTALVPLLFLTAAIAFGSASATSLASFFVDSSVHTGLHPGTAGAVMAMASILCLVVRVLAGWTADRRPKGHFLAIAIMLFGGSIGYLLLASGKPIFIPIGAAMGFGLGWGWPGLFILAVASRNPNAPAAATGITQAGGYLGGAAGPLLFGLIASHQSYAAAWRASAIVALFGMAAALWGRMLLRSDPISLNRAR